MSFNGANRIKKKLINWHNWPSFLFYFPISFVWLGYIIRSRSLWFYTASNPTLTFGGFLGESKSEMQKQLPPELFPSTIYIDSGLPFSEVLLKKQEAGFNFPFIVKPDIGMQGLLFRKIENERQLKVYHATMPSVYMIQEFIDMPREISVFYCRRPADITGTITAMIEKVLLKIKGNGTSTIKELIEADLVANVYIKKLEKLHEGSLEDIIPAGEMFVLSPIANLYNGARFIDLTYLVNERLVSLFDSLSRQTHFFYGRYDIKCLSIEDMVAGKDFLILEFNGAGSAPNHIHAGKYNLLQAYKEVLRHWKCLYEISKDNRQRGILCWKTLKGYHFIRQARKYFYVLKELEKVLNFNA